MQQLDQTAKLIDELRTHSNTIIDRYKNSQFATQEEGGTLVIQHPNGDSLHRDNDGTVVLFVDEWEMFSIDPSGEYTSEADNLRESRDKLVEFEQALSKLES